MDAQAWLPAVEGPRNVRVELEKWAWNFVAWTGMVVGIRGVRRFPAAADCRDYKRRFVVRMTS